MLAQSERPFKFKDLIGHDTTKKTIQNAFINIHKIIHLIIFSSMSALTAIDHFHFT